MNLSIGSGLRCVLIAGVMAVGFGYRSLVRNGFPKCELDKIFFRLLHTANGRGVRFETPQENTQRLRFSISATMNNQRREAQHGRPRHGLANPTTSLFPHKRRCSDSAIGQGYDTLHRDAGGRGREPGGYRDIFIPGPRLLEGGRAIGRTARAFEVLGYVLALGSIHGRFSTVSRQYEMYYGQSTTNSCSRES